MEDFDKVWRCKLLYRGFHQSRGPVAGKVPAAEESRSAIMLMIKKEVTVAMTTVTSYRVSKKSQRYRRAEALRLSIRNQRHALRPKSDLRSVLGFGSAERFALSSRLGSLCSPFRWFRNPCIARDSYRRLPPGEP